MPNLSRHDQSRSCISAIALAAGCSSRMGTVKPLVRIGGEPMLHRVLTNLRQSHVDEIVVVLGYSAQLVRENVALEDTQVVINDSYQQGMASSIRVGLANISPQAQATLIVLADQPFLQPATIDLLIHEYRTKRAKIIVPTYNGVRGNPVLLDRAVFSELDQLTGDVGFRAIFANHSNGIVKLAVQDPGVLVDLDTAADVERYERTGLEEGHQI